MTDFKKVFLGTAPIVYYLENNESHYPKMKRFWKECGNCDFVTSAVTITEYLTYPYQQNNPVGTVNTDRVNGGILAMTSFFTRDVYKFISDNKWNCQIKTHDHNVIKDLLSQVVTGI